MTSEGGHLPADELRRKHGAIYLVVAPPRSASTALARVFWEHPDVGFYCHEPFDRCYHRGLSLDDAVRLLREPLDIRRLSQSGSAGSALIVKEMTFQIGEPFPHLAAISEAPVIFLLRDPRLAIHSRMEKRRAGGQDPVFPLFESGWQALEQQVKSCLDLGIDYVLLDSSQLRNQPEKTVSHLFERLGLDFSPSLLSWQPLSAVALGALGSEQLHWYERVLSSRRIEPAVEQIPALESFPEEGGFRDHVSECLTTYRALLRDPRTLVV